MFMTVVPSNCSLPATSSCSGYTAGYPLQLMVAENTRGLRERLIFFDLGDESSLADKLKMQHKKENLL